MRIAAKRVTSLKSLDETLFPQSSIEAFQELLEEENFGSKTHLEKLNSHFNFIQKMANELKILPVEYRESSKKIYKYFIKQKVSPSYATRLISLLNRWGKFQSKATGSYFDNVIIPRGRELSAIAEAQQTKTGNSNVTTAKIADSNITTAKIADSNVTTAKIADSNVTTAKIADGNVTKAKLVAVGQQVSAVFGSFACTTTPAQITNFSLALTTSGRPVMINVQASINASGGSINVLAGSQVIMKIKRDSTTIGIYTSSNFTTSTLNFPLALNHIDVVSAGTYTYTIESWYLSGSGGNIVNPVMVIFEL